jgi:hypothetical protein
MAPDFPDIGKNNKKRGFSVTDDEEPAYTLANPTFLPGKRNNPK